MCVSVPLSPPLTTTRCGSNVWTELSRSCTSPSCRKENTPSSTRKQTRTELAPLFLCFFSYPLAICFDLYVHRKTEDICLWEGGLLCCCVYVQCVDKIDKATKCYSLLNGDEWKLLLRKKTREEKINRFELRNSVFCLLESRWCLGWQIKKKKGGGWLRTNKAMTLYCVMCWHQKD